MNQAQVEQRIVRAAEAALAFLARVREPRPAPAGQWAPWAKRAAAASVDACVYMSTGGGLLMLSAPFQGSDGVFAQLFVLAVVFVGVLGALLALPAWLLARPGERNGQTVGKRLVGIRVVRDDGTPWRFWPAVYRQTVVKLGIPGLLIVVCGALTSVAPFPDGTAADVFTGAVSVTGLTGVLVFFLWPLWGSERRGVHDLVCGSHVLTTARPDA